MKRKECEFCAGSGQLSHFQGVSRFLLSWEECQACGGFGFVVVEEDEADKPKKKGVKGRR